ncbi:unnamed protein product, partial [Symbiodinium sp. CCMP2592]
LATLDPLAKALSVEPESLVKELLVARPAAVNLFKRGELNPWGLAMKHWGSQRLPGLYKAVGVSIVLLILATWASTGEVEQAYSRVRLISQGIKSSTTTEHTYNQLKVVLDAPPADKLVIVSRDQDGRVTYKATRDGNMILLKYRSLYGGNTNVRVKSSDLPRRILGDRKRKTGYKAFTRERGEDRAAARSVLMSGESAAELEKLGLASALSRETEEQRHLLQVLQEQHRQKKKIFQDADPRSVQKKLREHEKTRRVKAENINSMERRSLTQDVDILHGQTCCIYVGSRSRKTSGTLEALGQIPNVECVTYDEAMAGMAKLLSAEVNVVWLFPTDDKMQSFVDPLGIGASISSAADETVKLQAIGSACRQIAPRMIGGYVAGNAFLQMQLAPANRSQMRKPILELEPGLWQNLELTFHDTKLSPNIATLITSILSESLTSPRGSLIKWSVKKEEDKV